LTLQIISEFAVTRNLYFGFQAFAFQNLIICVLIQKHLYSCLETQMLFHNNAIESNFKRPIHFFRLSKKPDFLPINNSTIKIYFCPTKIRKS